MQLSFIHYQILFIIFSIFFIYLILTKRYEQSFYLVMFTLPFKNVYFYFGGLYLELWKFYMLLYILLIPSFILKQSRYGNIDSTLILFLLYFVYSSFLTISFGLYLSFELDSFNNFFKEFFRPLIQIIFMLTFIGFILIPSIVLQNKESIFIAMNYYIKSIIFISLLALLQLFFILIFNHDIFPIPRLSEKLQELVLIDGEGTSFFFMKYRLTSICTEPKNFAVFLSLGLIFLVELKNNKLLQIKFYKSTLFLFIFCLILTFSTTGIIALLAYFFVKIFFNLRRSILPISLVILISIFYLIIPDIQSIIDARLFDKIKLEPTDSAVYKFFMDEPFYIITGVGYGNIHHFAANYLHWLAYTVFGKTTFTAISGFWYLIGSVGVIGLILIYMLFYNLYKTIKRIENADSKLFSNLLLVFMIFFLARNEVLIYIIAGIGYAYLNFYRKEKNGY